MHRSSFLLLFLSLPLLLPAAEVPPGVLYQGRLKEDGLHVNGTRTIVVAIYEAEAGGEALWSETHAEIPVVGGLFQIVLGSVTPLGNAILSGAERYLGVTVGSTTLPRRRLHSSATARIAGTAGGVVDGGVTMASLGDDITAELDGLRSDLDGLRSDLDNLTGSLTGLFGRLDLLESKTDPITRVNNGDTLRFTGVNVQIVDGSGSTHPPAGGDLSGVGNLIVGYDENAITLTTKTGQHNLVIGDGHSYYGSGGLVAGRHNSIGGRSCSISGGFLNHASTFSSSISGGWGNTSEANFASISGGNSNQATVEGASVSGGSLNKADGVNSSILGGRNNTTTGITATILGGVQNVASGRASVVVGGGDADTTNNVDGGNEAWADLSVVVGGAANTAGNDQDDNTDRAQGLGSVVGGGDRNRTEGRYSTVGGGATRVAEDLFDWVAGSLFESD